ncbi:acyl-CoA N-acyltransferase [Obelidium mucronatum]|nr:acyl-CoA N-acyltransferase [Obelidium mucronatum]
MFVVPGLRGRGVATRLVAALAEIARTECGARTLLLETGPYLTDAIRLYESCGFVRVPLFGEYKDKGDALSVCFGKDI